MEVVGSTFLRIQRIRHDEISLPTEIDIAWFSEDTPRKVLSYNLNFSMISSVNTVGGSTIKEQL